MRHIVLALSIIVGAAAPAQETLHLGAMQQQAIAADPRIHELELQAAESDLRLRNIRAERYPSLTVEGQAQDQSETVRFPFAQPGGGSIPAPPKDTYEAAIRAERPLFDPTLQPRIAAEKARLAEAQARLQTTLFTLRFEVNEAFFTAALHEEREKQMAAVITDLESRLGEAKLRVEQGVSLPSEPDALEATLLQRRQDASELRAGRLAALARLSELTDHTYPDDTKLALPELAANVASARANLDSLRSRPELAQFARTRERLETQKELVDAGTRLHVSAYGKAAVGRPGLDFLESDIHPYWLAGIRLQWKPWTWGTDKRERELLDLQKEAITADEEAFSRSLRRTLQNDLATIDHLNEISSTDDRIVSLRESIERETGARYDEQVVTAAEYIDKQTDVLEARLLRATHRVQLAQAEARLLTLLGLEVQ